MPFAIVKDGTNVVGKEVYCGDDAKVAELIAQKQNDAGSTFTYELVSEAAFNESEVSPSLEQTDWSSLKTVDEKINYLAKRLGLE